MKTTKFKKSQDIKNLIGVNLDPLIVINVEGKIIDINEIAVFFTGIEREKLIGANFSDYFTAPNKACEIYPKVFSKGLIVDVPLTLRYKKGKLTDVLFNRAIDKEDANKVVGLLIVILTKDATLKISPYQARILLERILDPIYIVV